MIEELNIGLNSTEKELNYHKFHKINLMTINGPRIKSHDVWECKCGVEAKLYTLGILTLKGKNLKNFKNECPKHVHDLNDDSFDVGKEIIVKKCSLFSSEVEFLTPDSEHKIVQPPEEYKFKYPNSTDTVWVMGKTEPVRLLTHEFKFK